MSMVLTRSPLEPIGMNGAGMQKRRSARLSHDGAEDNEPPAKKSKANGAQTTTTVSTKDQDGDANALSKRRSRKAYDEKVDGFAFSKGGRKGKEGKQPAVRNSADEQTMPAALPPSGETAVNPPAPVAAPLPPRTEDSAPKAPPRKTRRRLPTTPDREPVRRSKRISTDGNPSLEAQASPFRPSHAKSHAKRDRSPSPDKARPVTVERKRKRVANGAEEEEKIMRIALPFADTPVIRRNREMRKSSADGLGGTRRSSSGMRGRRASSLIEEGKGNALPHAEVPTAEFYKHISADLTEPRRMRCLLSWCGQRALPDKPEAPKNASAASSLEFQALQAALVVQAELAQDLITKGTLSDWFSRDDEVVPAIPLRKKANPRNLANAAKVQELEGELERLKQDRADWEALVQSAVPPSPPIDGGAEDEQPLSPLHPELLDSPQRAILEELQAPSSRHQAPVEPAAIKDRLQHISANLEFTVDQFAHGVHALSVARETADRLSERTLADTADVLEHQEKARGNGVDAMDALRALGRVLNGSGRRK
ncbi:hypothetical protein BAUCODRAFT_137475 [Baudoinia panamericana UAMH 10762]|uniref:Kinetochore protein Mis13 n=1 Tax=Baudoinia panamericana (strain UAMH 10762) TaxID=717646 RepID=M2NIQ3_BAUPA|nr:uncharacterized protein BAUCODRAFT_137475 [Baudoinia panamericana UAMH 10762]EMC99274.1 hypothetical protein BAUCODRAFT_137475 [Baudoinia panamericana UAMH 10762]